jgi:myo-inositol-1(or 4)-monophosphatase
MTAQAISWVRQAGRIALQHYYQNESATEKPDQTLLTQTDLELEKFLVSQIAATYPTHNRLAEEKTGNRRRKSAYTWVIDPLDGTTTFVRKLPGWGISLGLLYRNRPIFGLFYMPLLGDMTYATAEDGIYSEPTSAWAVRSDWQHNGFLAVSAGAHHEFQIDVARTRALGSISASLVYTARGSATAAFIPRAYLWDLVAGTVILNQAGGEIRYLSGRPVDYSVLLGGYLAPEPILAGHPALVSELQSAIRPWEQANQ